MVQSTLVLVVEDIELDSKQWTHSNLYTISVGQLVEPILYNIPDKLYSYVDIQVIRARFLNSTFLTSFSCKLNNFRLNH